MTGPRPAGDLASAYERCRRIAAEHGRTYYLATRLLPREHRSAVHALYGFARTVDDIVDVAPDGGQSAALDRIEDLFDAAVTGRPVDDPGTGPILAALADTIDRYGIDVDLFRAFLASMRMDVPGTPAFRATYPDMPALQQYMYGSAAVIGLQMLPVLGTTVPVAEAAPYAAALGEAFQLTNFLRDVGEDLDRGRVYLPADELAAFGVDADLLRHCRATGVSEPRVRRALAHVVAVTRGVYRRAEPGLELLEPRVRPGLRAAFVLYRGILDEIEDSGFRVLDRRVAVPRRRRLAVAAPLLVRTVVGAG
ncbi:phytoene/squalene synthase family protein [Prescottella subtropica]|uniref:phytoene/squalene synthase family protein n=1 Tax=Prescottella subtropica TaxID=2545757 RepID=UPI0010F73F3E|nr:phytoene/squalene synthase family protein [Prescottella subtropica]